MQPVTNRHPLAWVMDKISEAEATVSLEASDNNVLSILRSSIENVPSTSETTPREKENSTTFREKENSITNNTASAEGSSSNSPSLNESSSISPIIPLDSGIRMEDLLEPEVQQLIGSDIERLFVTTSQSGEEDGNVVSVEPVIDFDPQANYTPLHEDESLRIINEVFTPKIRGKVRTRGGTRRVRGGKKGILSQSRPRLLTSDEIFNIKVEQEKEKEEKKKRMEEKKKEKTEYHLKQLAKLQK